MGVIIINEMAGKPMANPYKEAEPLIFSIWRGKRVETIIFPSKDMTCPIINSEKFLFHFSFSS